MMAGEEKKPLVRREPDKDTPSLIRRTTRYPAGGGTVVYYPSGRGVGVVMPPSTLGRWYQRVTDWGEALIDVLEKLDNILYQPQPAKGPATHTSDIPNHVHQALSLLKKAGQVLLIAVYALWVLVRVRVKHLFGAH